MLVLFRAAAKHLKLRERRSMPLLALPRSSRIGLRYCNAAFAWAVMATTAGWVSRRSALMA